MSESPNSAAQEQRAQGRKHLERGEFGAAEAKLRRALLGGDTSIALKLELGSSLAGLGRFRDCRLLLEPVSGLPPEGKRLLALSFLRLGRADRAAALLTHDGPESALSGPEKLLLGYARLQAGDRAGCRALLAQVPDSASKALLAAGLSRMEGDLMSARTRLEALARTTDAPEVERELGAVLLALGANAESACHLEKALASGARDDATLFGCGLAAARASRWPAVAKAWDELSRRHPEDTVLAARASAAAHGGRPAPDPASALGRLAAGDHAQAERAWMEELKRDLAASGAAHHLAVLCLGSARELARAGDLVGAREAWRRTVAHWVFLLEHPTWLAGWTRERERVYGAAAPEGATDLVHSGAYARLQAPALEFAAQENVTPGAEPLPYRIAPLLAREREGAALLRKAGGLGSVPAAGPLWISLFGLEERLRGLFRRLYGLVEAPGAVGGSGGGRRPGGGAPALSEAERDEMARLFSTLGGTVALLGLGDARAACAAVESLCCRLCPHLKQPKCPKLVVETGVPQTCCRLCPSYDRCHPAYSVRRDGADLLFRDAAALALKARESLVADLFQSRGPDVEKAGRVIDDLLALAGKLGQADRARSALEELGISAAEGQAGAKRFAEAVAVLEQVQRVHPSAAVVAKLAEVLNYQAVAEVGAAGTEDVAERDWSASMALLRRALKINPAMPWTRANLADVLSRQVHHLCRGGDVKGAALVAAEAIAVLKEGIRRLPGEEKFASLLTYVEKLAAQLEEMLER